MHHRLDRRAAVGVGILLLLGAMIAPAQVSAHQSQDHPGVSMGITEAVRHVDGQVTASGWAACPPGEDWGVGFHMFEDPDNPTRDTGMASLSAPTPKVVCDGEAHPWTAKSQDAYAGGVKTDGQKTWYGKMQSPSGTEWIHKDKGDVGTVDVTSADLSLTMGDSPDPVQTGLPLTYTLEALNAGPAEAADVRVTDELPSTVEFQSADAACQHDDAAAGGTVTCDLGVLSPGVVAPVEIVVVPSAPGTLTNSASVASSSTGPHGEATGVADPDSSNNQATATTTVEDADPLADLAVTKTDSPDPVLVGSPLEYTLAVANTGPSPATGVEVTDPLPDGVEFVDATPSQGSCSEVDGTVTCVLGELSSSGTATVEIVGTPTAAGTVTNTASVSSSVEDPDVSNNASSTETTVDEAADPLADVQVSVSASPAPAAVGAPFTYTVGVTNAGPSTATDVVVTDQLPATVEFDSAVPQDTCAEDAGTVTCGLGELASGETATVDIVGTPTEAGTETNTASVSSGVEDPDVSNNASSIETAVEATADLAVTKIDNPDPAVVGSSLIYTVAVANAGPSPATGVVLTDPLPDGVAFTQATPSQGSCTEQEGTLTCPLGELPASEAATVEIEVVPTSPGTLTNAASGSSDAADPDPWNNLATIDTTVYGGPDLGVTQTDAPDPVLVGASLTYTLEVTNAGPGPAEDVVVTDELPATVEFETAIPSDGSCTEAQGTVTCVLEQLVAGATGSVEIVVAPTVAGTLTNTASVSSAAADPDPSNDTTSETTTVDAAPDLAVDKADSLDPASMDAPLTYTLEVTNGGSATAPAVVLIDVLPQNVTFTSAAASSGRCGFGKRTGGVKCALGDLPVGATATVEIVVVPTAAGTLTNTASVSSDVADADPSDDQATEETSVGT